MKIIDLILFFLFCIQLNEAGLMDRFKWIYNVDYKNLWPLTKKENSTTPININQTVTPDPLNFNLTSTIDSIITTTVNTTMADTTINPLSNINHTIIEPLFTTILSINSELIKLNSTHSNENQIDLNSTIQSSTIQSSTIQSSNQSDFIQVTTSNYQSDLVKTQTETNFDLTTLLSLNDSINSNELTFTGESKVLNSNVSNNLSSDNLNFDQSNNDKINETTTKSIKLEEPITEKTILTESNNSSTKIDLSTTSPIEIISLNTTKIELENSINETNLSSGLVIDQIENKTSNTLEEKLLTTQSESIELITTTPISKISSATTLETFSTSMVSSVFTSSNNTNTTNATKSPVDNTEKVTEVSVTTKKLSLTDQIIDNIASIFDTNFVPNDFDRNQTSTTNLIEKITESTPKTTFIEPIATFSTEQPAIKTSTLLPKIISTFKPPPTISKPNTPIVVKYLNLKSLTPGKRVKNKEAEEDDNLVYLDTYRNKYLNERLDDVFVKFINTFYFNLNPSSNRKN